MMTGLFPQHRVLLVDDHPVFRDGLKAIVDSHPQLRVVAEAASLGEALSQLKKEAIELVVTDLSLPDGTGQDLIEKALLRHPHLRILILSISRLGSDVSAALQAGAAGYLTKNASGQEVLQALDEVLQGRTYLHADVSNSVVDQVRTSVPGLSHLSPREQQILDLICQGRTPKQICAQLHLAPSTVKTHLRSLYRKMKVSTRTSLVLKVLSAVAGAAPSGTEDL